MAAVPEISRRERILDAAENAFADFGFEGASLRHIVLDAGVNLATVYYYFDSKEGLMVAVLKRRIEPLQVEHLSLLNQFEKESPGQPVPVEKVVEALVVPPLRLAQSYNDKSPVIMRLIGRIVTEPHEPTQVILREQYKEMRGVFLRALRLSLPALPEADLLWRMELLWGGLAFILCNPRQVKAHTEGLCDPHDFPAAVRQMIRFFSAGFRSAPLIG